MKAAGFFRKPVDGTALLDSINWALKSETKNQNNKQNKNNELIK